MLAAATVTEPEWTQHLSTGIIGSRLPLEKVRTGLAALDPDPRRDRRRAARRGDGPVHDRFADQGRDDDRGAARCRSAGRSAVRVSGVAKGVGMIHPQMATMLSVILTDANVAPEILWPLLRPAAARTWNQLSVDGDTSTNDTVLVLASGVAGAAPAEDGSAAAATLGRAIEAIARDLARQQAADGEGASTLITAAVSGARDDAEARAVARAVISSSLVKAAAHGRDPNWGRIAGAAGNARLADRVGPRGGRPAGSTRRRPVPVHRPCSIPRSSGSGSPATSSSTERGAARSSSIVPLRVPRCTRTEVVFALDLGLGAGSGEGFGCDLTEAYVIENSEYTT